MVSIKVSAREKEIIYYAYRTSNITPNFIEKNDTIIVLDKERENLNIMFHCILDTFIKVGLGDNDEPNSMGFELEALNEKINYELIKLNDKL